MARTERVRQVDLLRWHLSVIYALSVFAALSTMD
jgi:hypothetical protein